MSKKINIKAHDILSDEELDLELFSKTKEDNGIADNREKHYAQIIYSYLSSKKDYSWNDEKKETKEKIKLSLYKTQRRKNYAKWVVAASIILAVFSGWFIQNSIKRDNQIVSFAQALEIVTPDSVTNLFLNDGKKVSIYKEEPSIIYDDKGKQIVVDSIQKISQEIVNEKSVYNTLVVPYGKRTQITLSDGSTVWLNSGSKLVYPANMKEKRNVYIEGEAVFEVTHSEQHPFLVSTKDFEIKVLGTIFNVSAYPDDKVSSTVLEKGKIELTSNNKSIFRSNKLTIHPGTMALYNPEEKLFFQHQVDPRNYLSWRDGYFIFKNENLENILKKLERYYNIEIVLNNSNLGKEKFSGQLNLKDSPEEVLKVIAKATPLKIKKSSNKLIID